MVYNDFTRAVTRSIVAVFITSVMATGSAVAAETEYKLFKHFAIGAGLARMGTNVEVNDDDWKGQVSDSHRGYTLFGTFYF